VAYYRKHIDSLLCSLEQKRPSSGASVLNFEPQPQKSFSRGFTTYFLSHETQIAAINTAKSTGEVLGTIQHFDQQSITIASKTQLKVHAGDGVCFFDKKGLLHGANVNTATGNQLYLQNTTGATTGTTIFRNFDVEFQRKLKSKSAVRLIQVKIIFDAVPQSVQLTAIDEDGIAVTLKLNPSPTLAKDKNKAVEMMTRQFGKSGNALFHIAEVIVKCEPVYFYTLSELNSQRRMVLEQLEQKRLNSFIIHRCTITKDAVAYPKSALGFNANVLNKLARRFYEHHGVLTIDAAYEQNKPIGAAPLMIARYCILRELKYCKQHKVPAEIKEPLFLVNNRQRLRLHFDCSKCEMSVLNE
jgi:putative protease